MDLCKQHNFDPERSVILTKVDPNTTLMEVRRCFDHLDEVKKIERLGDRFSGELLCEFQEVTTPLIAEEEYLNADGQNVWGVLPLEGRQIEDMQPHSSSPTPIQSEYSGQTLDDMADQLLVQIESLAQLHCVNVNDLSQQVATKLAHKADGADRGPSTSTPAPRKFDNVMPASTPTVVANSAPKVSFAFRADSPPVERNATHETPITFTIPQDVQRVVVEHVVKHDSDYQGHVPSLPKLRMFSGQCPKPNGEVDFITWKLYARQLLSDTSLMERHKRRHILDSLLPPALNVALGVGTNAPPETYARELEKAYGSVTGGDELYIQFIETHQNRGEKPSDYLRRLHSLMQEVVEKRGVVGKHSDTLLLKQFIRGCWDEVLITQLRLKDLLSDSVQPDLNYSSLLFKLRSFEHEKQLKEKRMNLHLCMPPVRAQSQVHTTDDQGIAANTEKAQANRVLTERIKELEAEVAKAKAQKPASVKKLPYDQHQSIVPNKKMGKEGKQSRPVPQTQAKSLALSGFCYRCGEDSHYLQQCTNPVNAA